LPESVMLPPMAVPRPPAGRPAHADQERPPSALQWSVHTTTAPSALMPMGDCPAPGARAQSGQAITGLWDATLDLNGTKIPFKMEFAGDGNNVKGWFFNGDEKEISNSGKFENGSLILNFESYASVLKLNLKNGALDGDYSTRGKQVGAIHAVRATGRPSADAGAPDIDGIWDVENVNSSKKDEKAWRLIVHQTGGDVSGAILRVDGDTGTLTGGYKDGKFVLSHFSGARPALLTITPQRDGTLAIELAGLHHEGQIYAIRPAEARAKGLPAPTNADQHTGHDEGHGPSVVDDNPKHDGHDASIGKAVAQDQHRQQFLGFSQQAADVFSRTRRALLQLAQLPLAQREKRRLRQRKEKTRPGKNNQGRHGSPYGNRRHPRNIDQ